MILNSSRVYVLLCAVLIAKLCLTATAWTVACQAPLSMEFSRQEYWSGLPFPLPEDLPDPGIEPVSPALAEGFFTTEVPGKPSRVYIALQTQPQVYWKDLQNVPCYFLS